MDVNWSNIISLVTGAVITSIGFKYKEFNEGRKNTAKQKRDADILELNQTKSLFPEEVVRDLQHFDAYIGYPKNLAEQIWKFNERYSTATLIFHNKFLNTEIKKCVELTEKFAIKSAELTIPDGDRYTTRVANAPPSEKQRFIDESMDLYEIIQAIRATFFNFYTLAKEQLHT